MREDGTSEATEAPEAAPKRTGMLVLVAVLLLSIGAGGAVGMTVIGPRLTAAPSAGQEEEADHGGGHGGGHGKSSATNLLAIESLVVNPAGTAGTRFLILSVVVEMDDAKVAESLKARDPAVRDALLSVLGAKTIEELSEMSAREDLRTELAAAIAALPGSGKVRRIFLPQYVLQ